MIVGIISCAMPKSPLSELPRRYVPSPSQGRKLNIQGNHYPFCAGVY
jgi:hypothetical protein